MNIRMLLMVGLMLAGLQSHSISASQASQKGETECSVRLMLFEDRSSMAIVTMEEFDPSAMYWFHWGDGWESFQFSPKSSHVFSHQYRPSVNAIGASLVSPDNQTLLCTGSGMFPNAWKVHLPSVDR